MESQEKVKMNITDIIFDEPFFEDCYEDALEGEEGLDHCSICTGCMDCLGLSWRDFL
jgi:hypothetical protein